MKFAEVILPLPLEGAFTYVVPDSLEATVRVRCRVTVPFGQKRYYTAIVKEIHDFIPETSYALKEILSVLDERPVVTEQQLAFWQWIASYYICSLGEVYNAALPSGLKLESETAIYYNNIDDATELTLKEQLIVDAFASVRRLTVAQLERITGMSNIIPRIHRLLDCGVLTVSEEIKKGYTAKKETCVRLNPSFDSEDKTSSLLEQLARAGQQQKLFLRYLELAEPFKTTAPTKEVSKKQLLESSGCTSSILTGLVKRGYLELYDKEIGRLSACSVSQPIHRLTPPQQKALNEIKKSFADKRVCLLHGVPSCGKTEIYLHLIADMLRQGKQTLFLLPEIAVTTQITERLSAILGDRLLIYHSGFSDAERVEIWNKIAKGGAPYVVLGVRSSIFLPFDNLGLVIVDEEHDSSYKQQDPAPRYHARNAAIVLAQICGAKTLLGSGTPSLDSVYNAKSGKYGLVTLSARYGNGLSPRIYVIDTKELKRKKIMKDNIISPFLKQKIDEALRQGEQVILFRNRRGFAPIMECKTCGHSVRCTQCDVSLTCHKKQNRLVCHYCGYSTSIPRQCPSCGHSEMRWMGFGTEKIEEEISALYPDVRTARLDLDSARNRKDYERILSDFGAGNTQILIGTQMVSKGFDFARVTVVGVLNADSLMNYPDFRSCERAFQLMVQVSGRAGRRDRQGIVVIQTSQPEHPVLQTVKASDFEAMATSQLGERYLFKYPPYFRLITIVMRGKDETVLDQNAALFVDTLKEEMSNSYIYGPCAPPVNRIQTLYIRNIILKIRLSERMADIRISLNRAYAKMQRTPSFKQLSVYYDVDN